MVRIRYPDSVKIQLSGVKSIIPKTRIEIGRRSMTWLTFLNEVCGIELDSSKNYFMCTSGYSPNHSIEGWTASLNDPIDQFVVRFTKKLSKYGVRLHKGRRPTQKTNTPKTGSTQVKSKPRITSSVICDSPLVASPLARPTKTVVARKFASIMPMKPSQLAKRFSTTNEAEECISSIQKRQKNITESSDATNKSKSNPVEICEVDFLELENSENDIGGAAEMDGPEINDKKSDKNNLVDRFEQEVDKMDDSTLEKVCREIQNLRRNGMWERNLKRSPLACSLLWELCKE